ncbi:MAG TPA: cysteine--tRNA ligase [Actinomycetota bacterium]|nr:cysteine--tRNA ligase [Actinomycetota bacterium]
MSIRIYDSMERAEVPLSTRDEGRVTMYVCGATVYNFIHIGNARTMVWFDQIRRYLRYRGYETTYVSNHTDVDDKIIERAKLEDLPPDGITSKYIRAFDEDMAALNVQPPDVMARATQHVPEMIEAIEGLIERGLAYEAGGDVWFAVERFPGYGKLSHRSLEDMRAGERVEPRAGKEHPLDFALWKAAKEGEPSWPSPGGPGRPGWHIECSVMSTKYLGMGFDLHGGGTDLVFPHHENEIAQAEGLAGSEPFSRHWMHAGMVQMDAEKMSKSLGNVAIAREVIGRWGGEAARYWCLNASYRSQASFGESSMEDAVQAYGRWRTFYEAAKHALGDRMPDPPSDPRRPSGGDDADATGYVTRFIEAMDDDLNSAGAFAVIHDLVREGNKLLEDAQRNDADAIEASTVLMASFLELTTVLGFTFAATSGDSGVLPDILDYLLELREEARGEKAFDRADAIRDRLESLGVSVEDTPAGPRWRLPTTR